MSQAEVVREERGLESIVERPLETVTYLSIPSFKIQTGSVLGSSGVAGGVPVSGLRITAVPYNPKAIEEIDWRYAIFSRDLVPYWDWIVRTSWEDKAPIRYPNGIGGESYDSVFGVIKADIDKVALYEQSPTLKSMAEALKNSLYGYEFAMTFTGIKTVEDLFLAAYNFFKGRKLRSAERDMYISVAKAHGKAAVVDGVLFMTTYGIKEYMLQRVAEIIQSPAGEYPSKKDAVDAVLTMINQKYFPFVNGPMKLVGNVLMVGIPLISITSHYILVRRAYGEIKEIVRRLREAIREQ